MTVRKCMEWRLINSWQQDNLKVCRSKERQREREGACASYDIYYTTTCHFHLQSLIFFKVPHIFTGFVVLWSGEYEWICRPSFSTFLKKLNAPIYIFLCVRKYIWPHLSYMYSRRVYCMYCFSISIAQSIAVDRRVYSYSKPSSCGAKPIWLSDRISCSTINAN
jgi:hypothetical protein